jgi:hypothetical protein
MDNPLCLCPWRAGDRSYYDMSNFPLQMLALLAFSVLYGDIQIAGEHPDSHLGERFCSDRSPKGRISLRSILGGYNLRSAFPRDYKVVPPQVPQIIAYSD